MYSWFPCVAMKGVPGCHMEVVSMFNPDYRSDPPGQGSILPLNTTVVLNLKRMAKKQKQKKIAPYSIYSLYVDKDMLI